MASRPEQLVPAIVLAAAVGIAVWLLFPRTVVNEVPRIVTHWDTVPVTEFDTVWRTRTIREIVREAGETVNLVETVKVTLPETVFVDRPAICPQVLTVPNKIGDETVIEGFTLTPTDSGGPFLRRQFRSVYYTRGPFKAMGVTDSMPPLVTFYDPVRTCGFFCQALRVTIGAAGGYAACKIGG